MHTVRSAKGWHCVIADLVACEARQRNARNHTINNKDALRLEIAICSLYQENQRLTHPTYHSHNSRNCRSLIYCDHAYEVFS